LWYCRIAGAAFTTIASTGPTTGTLYIVDSFMVVVLVVQQV
jgi:urea transport system permease protein